MRKPITTVLCVGFILFVALSLHLGGCQKKVTGDKAGAVEGFVKNSLTLIPIVGADVFLDDEPCINFPETDSTGYYKVGMLLGAPKLIRITIKSQGYKTQDKNVILKPNKIQKLDFFLIKE